MKHINLISICGTVLLALCSSVACADDYHAYGDLPVGGNYTQTFCNPTGNDTGNKGCNSSYVAFNDSRNSNQGVHTLQHQGDSDDFYIACVNGNVPAFSDINIANYSNIDIKDDGIYTESGISYRKIHLHNNQPSPEKFQLYTLVCSN